MRILITGASTFFAPPLIRGFGLRGIEVTAADSRWLSVGKAAPHAVRRLHVPLLSRDPEGFLKALTREVRARPYDLVLPTFEESLLLAEYRDGFEPFTQLFLPSFDTMWQVHDKPSLYELCQELRIPAPPTVAPQSPVGLDRQVAALRFPVVLKLPTANNCVGRSYCDELDDLIERYNGSNILYERAKASEKKIPPPTARPTRSSAEDRQPVIYALCSVTEVANWRSLSCSRLPRTAGPPSTRESISHPEIAALTEKLAIATGWSGFLGMDFIVDHSDRTPYAQSTRIAPPAVRLGYLAGVDWTGILSGLQGRNHARSPDQSIRTRSILRIRWLWRNCKPQRN